jgi:septal ring factor EnvC (AmiA/AmiB activator)
VVRDATTGRIDGVRYDELAPILLNEMQQQRAQMTAKIDAQAAEIRDLKKQQLTTQAEQLRTQQQMAVMSTALQKLQGKDAVIAQR